MTEIHGKLGAVYYSRGWINAITIAFNDNDPDADTITDSGTGFVTAGFTATDKITVAGSDSNDGTYTLGNVAAGVLTLDEADELTNEEAGDDITIVNAIPGNLAAGFLDWSVDLGADVVEITDFADEGVKAYIAGGTGWTAAARRHWITDALLDSWLGNTYLVRFFVQYKATPSADPKAYYYHGRAIVTGIAVNEAHDAVVEQALTFQGIGALTFATREEAWP